MAKKALVVGITILGILFCTSIVLLGLAYSRIDQFEILLSDCTTELQHTRGELQQTEVVLETTEQNKFFFYYTELSEQRYGVDELDDVLSQYVWAREYSEHVFDCTEMSAYLERYLENNGFNTIIVLGKSPDGSGEGHAWLLVEVTPGKYMPVEATLFSIVYWKNPYFDDYFKYQARFESIHEALDDKPDEFDWWQS